MNCSGIKLRVNLHIDFTTGRHVARASACAPNKVIKYIYLTPMLSGDDDVYDSRREPLEEPIVSKSWYNDEERTSGEIELAGTHLGSDVAAVYSHPNQKTKFKHSFSVL